MNIQSINNYNLNNNYMQNTAFKGKKPPSGVDKFFAEYFGKKFANSEKLRGFAEWMAEKNIKNLSGNMQIAGSALTSATYMYTTMKKADFKKEDAGRLATYQAFCFLVPTAAGLIINKGLNNKIKKFEYAYSAAQEKKLLSGKLSKEQAASLLEKLPGRLKAIRVASSVIIFSTMYRFVGPVGVTPLSNAYCNWRESRKAKKRQQIANAQIALA